MKALIERIVRSPSGGKQVVRSPWVSGRRGAAVAAQIAAGRGLLVREPR